MNGLADRWPLPINKSTDYAASSSYNPLQRSRSTADAQVTYNWKPLNSAFMLRSKALTNYLLQAVIIVPVCLGFNLFGRVTPSLAVLLAFVVWSVEVPASVWWLKRFPFGPAE